MTHHSLIHPGVALLHAHLEGMIAATSANAYWKDKNGKYLGANDWQIQRFGARSHDHIVGTTDYDFLSQENANFITENDRQVVAIQHGMIITEPMRLALRLDSQMSVTHYLSCKSPLLNQHGKVIGIFGLSYLLCADMKDQQMMHEIGMVSGIQGTAVAKNIIAKFRRSSLNLTDRQIECLIHLIKGKTVKKIAESMSLSHRTVEHYIEAIKFKLNCHSRSELIEKMMDLGLIDIGI